MVPHQVISPSRDHRANALIRSFCAAPHQWSLIMRIYQIVQQPSIPSIAIFVPMLQKPLNPLLDVTTRAQLQEILNKMKARENGGPEYER